MANIFNPDFRDFIQALINNKVEYILLGGYAVILHGYSRTTGDMDIWVRRTAKNYEKLEKAFLEFRMPVFDMTQNNFLYNDDFDVFSFGVPPVSIDILVKVTQLDFNEAIKKATFHDVEGLKIKVIHINDLIQQKMAVNRPKDQNDIQQLKNSLKNK